jgi:hypothetical protein
MNQIEYLDDGFFDIRIGLWPHRWTLREAAELERQCLLAVRKEFPLWKDFLVQGQPRKMVRIDLDNQSEFTETILRLRRTHPRAKYHDIHSADYTADSAPSGIVTSNLFYNPSSERSMMPPWNISKLWMMSFFLVAHGKRPGGDDITLRFLYGIETHDRGFAPMLQLFERLISICNPEFIRFAQKKFDEVMWEADHRIGWLNYFSHPPLVEQVLKHPRARPFHKGVFLQLSDDPADMMDDAFAMAAFEYAQTLAPYWPPLLDG